MKTKSAKRFNSNFRTSVFRIVKEIPAGRVLNYGAVATLVGRPRAARQVGFALRSLTIEESDIPWWRVVNREGYLSIDHGQGGTEKEIQRSLLQSEGVEVSSDFRLNMKRYLWTG